MHKAKFFVVIGYLLVVGLSFFAGMLTKASSYTKSQTVADVTKNKKNKELKVAVNPDFISIFKSVSPAVVHISTYVRRNNQVFRYGIDSSGIPGFLRYQTPEQYSESNLKEKGIGSGFIISDDGYILTNNHVVLDADEIIVKLSDHRALKAVLVGADKRSDLALLKVTAENKFPTVKLGESHLVEPGEWVAAIGSPFNFERSITKGIVSAKNRNLPDEMYVPFLQLDVSINQGNSGGPLLNLAGEVIGITSHIFSHTGGFMGVAFAIPIDHAVWAVEQLKKHGYVKRGWLGVYVLGVDYELAKSLGLKKPIGALLGKVVEGGPADQAGLKKGDVIIRFNNREIDESEMLPVYVGVVEAGSKAEVEYVRSGKTMNTVVEVGELPNNRVAVQQQVDENNMVIFNRMGLVVEELTEHHRMKMNLGKNVEGVVIKKIVKNTLADKIKLQLGDVITDLGGVHIDSEQKFREIVTRLPLGSKIPLRIIRSNRSMYLTFLLR